MPAEAQPCDHPETDAKRTKIIGISPLADPDPGVKCDRAFNDSFTDPECSIQEMSIELQIDFRLEHRHQSFDTFSSNKLVRGAYVGERAPSQVF